MVDRVAAEHDVAVMYRFAAAGEGAMAEAKGTILDDYIPVTAVVRILVRQRPFSTFQGDRVVVYRHVAVLDMDVGTHINIHGIGAGCLDRFLGREDMEVKQLHPFAFIEMGGPKGGVNQSYSRNLHVFAVRDIDEAGPQLLDISAVRVYLPAQPERLPIAQPVPVYRSLAGYGEPVDPVGINQGGEVVDALSLDAGRQDREVAA